MKFYTAETVATLSDQSAEMRADVLEAWVETLDNDNIEHGAKVLANVLTTEAVHADMTRAHVNQVLDALRDHEDKFAAIGGIRGKRCFVDGARARGGSTCTSLVKNLLQIVIEVQLWRARDREETHRSTLEARCGAQMCL